MDRKVAFLTEYGQDGSYLAELLLGKGYEVHAIVRRASLLRLQGLSTCWYKNLQHTTEI